MEKLRYQIITTTREEETVRLIFSCCAFIPEFKLNTDWQMGISSKTVCVVEADIKIKDDLADVGLDRISVQWDQFRLCDDHFLKLCKRLHFIGAQRAILTVRVNQLWELRSSHPTLQQFVINNCEWFSPKLTLIIRIFGTFESVIFTRTELFFGRLLPFLSSSYIIGIFFQFTVRVSQPGFSLPMRNTCPQSSDR